MRQAFLLRASLGFCTLLGFAPVAGAQSLSVAGVPKSFVPSVCATPAPTATAVSICVNDGNGKSLPFLIFNPQSHTVQAATGVAAEATRAMQAEATNAAAAAAAQSAASMNASAISNYGTMAKQSAGAVAITGGSADGLTLNPTTPAPAHISQLDVSQALNHFAYSPNFTEAAGVLGRGMIFDSGTFAAPGTVTVPAGKELDVIGWREQNLNVGAGGTSDLLSFQLTVNGAAGNSNSYGVIGALHNAGAGATKALYGRVLADPGCNGCVIAGIVGGAETRSSVNTSFGIQLTHTSFDGTPINYGMIQDMNGDSPMSFLPMQYGYLLSQKVQIQAGGSAFQGFGGGAGNAFTWLNGAGSAVLASIDHNGNGLFNSLSVPDQQGMTWANNTRSYTAQALDNTQAGGERWRLTVSGVGDGLSVDAGLNVGVGGMLLPLSAKGALGLINGTCPTAGTAISGGGVVCVSGGALYFVGSNGTSTKLAGQ